MEADYGGVAAWLRGHGLSEEDLGLLRARLREPDATDSPRPGPSQLQ